jgi:hypothetical protein
MLEKILAEFTKFTSIVFVFLIPACLLGALYWKKLSTAYRWLVIFLWFDLLIELGARWWVWWPVSANNLPLLHLYTLGELIIWLCFFSELAPPAQKNRYRMWLLPVLAVLVVANSLWIQPLNQFNSYAKTLVQLTIILLSLQYEFNFLRNEPFSPQESTSFRWVNRAALLYFSGSMFVFMFSEFALIAWKQGYSWLWDFNILLNVMLHLILLLSIWKTARAYPMSST